MATFTTTFADLGLSGINSGGSGVYATVRSGNNLGVDGAATGSVFNSFDGANYTITRRFLTFDTSSLPDNATVISAFIRFPGAGTKVDTNSESIQIVSATHSADQPVTGDFGNVGSSQLGTVAISAWSDSANNDITLSAGGIAIISVSAKSKFGVRTSGDIGNSAPTNPGNRGQFTTSSVILSVTYSTPELLGDFKFI